MKHKVLFTSYHIYIYLYTIIKVSYSYSKCKTIIFRLLYNPYLCTYVQCRTCIMHIFPSAFLFPYFPSHFPPSLSSPTFFPQFRIPTFFSRFVPSLFSPTVLTQFPHPHFPPPLPPPDSPQEVPTPHKGCCSPPMLQINLCGAGFVGARIRAMAVVMAPGYWHWGGGLGAVGAV